MVIVEAIKVSIKGVLTVVGFIIYAVVLAKGSLVALGTDAVEIRDEGVLSTDLLPMS
jgi:hypothetical protein